MAVKPQRRTPSNTSGSTTPRLPSLTRYQPSQYLHLQGESRTNIYRITQGILALEAVSANGQRCILQFLGPGSLLGGEALWQDSREFDARACTEMEIERCFDATHHDDAAARTRVAEEVAQQAIRIARTKVTLHHSSAYQRVLQLLLVLKALHPPQTRSVWLPTRSDMADFLDINLATASRLVTRLQRDAVLHVEGLASATVDWDKVQELLSRD